MSISVARQAAYQILRRVEGGRVLAIDLLQSAKVSALRKVDRGLLTELVMGVLRWRSELNYRIERLSGRPLKYFDPEVATVLRLGIYQIGFLDRIPKSAVVNEAVELTRVAGKGSAAGLVNAVLRKCDPPARLARRGESAAQPDHENDEAALRSLPGWLLDRWTQNFGWEVTKSLALASVLAPPTTLRVSEGERAELQRQLAEEGIGTQPARYASQALMVESGCVQSSQLWRAGCVVIQDEASQLVGALVAPQPGQRVLDLCAAPGIKTAQVATALCAGTLVACDLSFRRLRVMKQLISRHIPPGVQLQIVQQDATRHLALGLKFDRVLLDVPCSGTGTLSRNPEIKWRLQPHDLVRLADMQAMMLRNALSVLAPGGRLVYASCSLEPEESDQVVEIVLERSQNFRLLTGPELSNEFPSVSQLFDPRGYFRTRPDLHAMDGFFAAVIVQRQPRRV